jgi:hypothetical protein
MREADEFESWTNQVMEGPAVDAYMSGKSPALAHFADQLDKGAETNFRKTQQGMAEGDDGRDKHYYLRNDIWRVMDGDELVHEYKPERNEIVGAKKLLARFDDDGYDVTHVVSPMGVVTYLYGKPEEDMEEGIAEGEERVDTLVTTGLGLMRGPKWLDAVAAIKYQVGERDYRERKQFYDFFVQQLVDKKKAELAAKKDVAEEQLSEIGNTPAGRAALGAVQNRAYDKMDAWSANPTSGYSSTPKDVRKATSAGVAAGNRLHGFGPDNSRENTVMARDALRQKQGMAEGEEHSAVASALTGHIMRQRLDLLKMYGPVKVTQAIDDAAEHYGNPDEIGSSDMYAYVQYVENALSGMTEGLAEGFGSYYSEQLAEKVFAQMPNLQNQDDIISAGYDMAKQEPNLGASVDGIFRDRDFVSDFVTNYGYLQKQGMSEDLDTDGVMMTRPSNMSSESVDPLIRLRKLAMNK